MKMYVWENKKLIKPISAWIETGERSVATIQGSNIWGGPAASGVHISHDRLPKVVVKYTHGITKEFEFDDLKECFSFVDSLKEEASKPTLKVKLLPGGRLPKRAHPADACWDLYARKIEYEGVGVYRVHTGVAIEPPKGFSANVYARSSLSKSPWILANSVGIIDNQYRGEIQLRFRYVPYYADTAISGSAMENYFPYKEGDRIAQMNLVKDYCVDIEQVEELSVTERGDGGFGSTGKN